MVVLLVTHLTTDLILIFFVCVYDLNDFLTSATGLQMESIKLVKHLAALDSCDMQI